MELIDDMTIIDLAINVFAVILAALIFYACVRDH